MKNHEILKRLFSSSLRVKLLSLFLSASNERFYIREAARQIGEDAGNVSRELNNLEAVGLLKSDHHGHQKYYFVNHTFFLFPEIRNIFLMTMGSRLKKGRNRIYLESDQSEMGMTTQKTQDNVKMDLYQKRWQILTSSRVGKQETVIRAGETLKRMRRKIPGWSSVEEIRKWRDRFHEDS